MRISTAQIYRNGLTAMQSRQMDLSRTQQQLATGKRLLTPADDPAASAQALKLHERIASIEQYARNAEQAATRLGQEEAACSSFSELNSRFPTAPPHIKNRAQTERQRIGCT